MEPLAYIVRPKEFSDVIGQDHLVGEFGVIKKMIDKNQYFQTILFGPPGCGKTTIASILFAHFSPNAFMFNASTDNKDMLKEIVEASKYHDNVFVVIDEIHRMKKDIQDFLLPYLETNKILILGLTTENPYISINPAIRSRCHIYKMNNILQSDIKKLLNKIILKQNLFTNYPLSDEILDYISYASGLEIRTAINMLESLTLLDKEITLKDAENLCGVKSLKLDDKGINYYDLLSALQKSIRGSDVNASLHYLARLIKLEDLEIICRRLSTIAYEDIGLANPQIGPRCYAACMTARHLGFPEARIPLSQIVIDMAISPKSNTAESAIDNALSDIDGGVDYPIPSNILNREIKGGVKYLYPHDYPDDFVYQQYLPTQLFDKVYYVAKETGKYERALKERNDYLQKVLKQKKA